MFLQVSVILLKGGLSASVHAGIPPGSRHLPKSRHLQSRHPPESRHSPRADTPQEQTPPKHGHPPPLRANTPRADTPLYPKSRHPPRADTLSPQEQTHPRADPPRADTPPPGPHPMEKLRGSDPGPHPRGKLRGIRSRPTPKGEIEGDQIQPPSPRACWEIRSMRRRYVSYWNAILFNCIFTKTTTILGTRNLFVNCKNPIDRKN